jgi:KRAB domain-containing zinc finger protein
MNLQYIRKYTLEKIIVCDICGYKTIHKLAIEIHQKRHLRQFKLKCNVFEKGFYALSELQEHRNIHTGEKPFQCDLCGKAYPYNHNLNARKRTIHLETKLEKKMNQCEMCGKMYAYKKSLQLHMNSHTGANAYIGDICGKSLTNEEHLKVHRRTHMSEKPNVCDVCGRAFSKRCDLKLHHRTHTGEHPYMCEICNKSFHKRYHTGQRPYECHLCNKSFVCKALLNSHQKSHAI